MRHDLPVFASFAFAPFERVFVLKAKVHFSLTDAILLGCLFQGFLFRVLGPRTEFTSLDVATPAL
ncbi:hypothetical protein E4K68_18940 [Desulfosporosinus sp. Sb-LF]|nr:hypothetical protein E4K68_18940 [Desulfosporosinus sp. Sb-LF]